MLSGLMCLRGKYRAEWSWLRRGRRAAEGYLPKQSTSVSQLGHPVPYDHLLRTSWKRHTLRSSPLCSPKATFWPVLKWLENMFFLQICFFQASVYFVFLKFSGLVSLESQHSWSPPPVPACLNWDGALSCFLRALAKSLGICLLFISWEFSINTCLDSPYVPKKKSFFPWHEYWIIFVHKGILYWCLTNDWKDKAS